MALSDTKLRNLKPGDKPYCETDEGGLHIEVMPGGAKVWRLRYRVGGRGSKQEKITLGDTSLPSSTPNALKRHADKMTTDFPTAPSAYGLNGPSAGVTVEKSPHASHTEILTPPQKHFETSRLSNR